MKRLILYLAVACVTFGIILYAKNPELFHDIWLWVLGMFGVFTGYLYELLVSIKKRFAKKDGTNPNLFGDSMDKDHRIQKLETVVYEKEEEIKVLKSTLHRYSTDSHITDQNLKPQEP